MGHRQQQKNIANSLRRLRTACDAFDAGDYRKQVVIEDQSLLIAGQLRVLLVDSKGTPLFRRASEPVEDFFDSRTRFASSRKATELLVETGFGGMIGASVQLACFVANLDSVPMSRVPFEQWWEQPILTLPPESGMDERTVCRMQVVKKMSNEDGYAHYCENATKYWVDLKRDATGFMVGSFSGPTRPTQLRIDELRKPRWIAHATVRQIGHEVLRSMIQGYEKKPSPSTGFTLGGFGASLKRKE